MRVRSLPRLLLVVPLSLAAAFACGSDDDTKHAPGGGAGEAGGGAAAAATEGGDAGTPSTPEAGAPTAQGGAGGEAAASPAAGAEGALIGGASSVCDETSREACEPIVTALSGLRWEIPCGEHLAVSACNAQDPEPVVATMQGVPDGLYDVTLRFRGVIELESYTPMPASGTWVKGATPANDGNNIYSLTISDPPATYYLNAGEHLPYCQVLDEEHAVQIRGGATVTLFATAYDGGQVTNVDENGEPLVVPGVSPAPEPYDGQFVRMDVVDIQAAM